MKEDNIIKIYEKIKSKPLYAGVIILIFIILTINLIQIPFWVGRFKGIPVDFNVGDILNFVGTILAGIATIFLGLIAYSQNEKLSKMNKQIIDIQNQSLIPVLYVEEKILKSSRYPYEDNSKDECQINHKILEENSLLEISIKRYDKIKIVERSSISLELKNITENIIRSISVVELKTNILNDDKSKFDIYNFEEKKNGLNYIIRKNDSIGIKLDFFTEKFDGRIIDSLSSIKIKLLVHSLKMKYHQEIEILVSDKRIVKIEYDL